MFLDTLRNLFVPRPKIHVKKESYTILFLDNLLPEKQFNSFISNDRDLIYRVWIHSSFKGYKKRKMKSFVIIREAKRGGVRNRHQ